jgi:hypothetical protein
MSALEKIGLIACGIVVFAIILGARMVSAKIAPRWMVRFIAPPARQ